MWVRANRRNGGERYDYGHPRRGAPFDVIGSTPANGAAPVAPATFEVVLSESVAASSVAANALTITTPGLTVVHSTGVTLVGDHTLDFSIPSSAYTGDGTYTVALAGGAVSSLTGKPMQAFSASFVADTVAPTVANCSLHAGDIVLAIGNLSVQVQFSKAMAAQGINPASGTLVNGVTGASVAPAAITYDPTTYTATLSYQSLTPGTYTLSLASSPTAFCDSYGLPLAGDGADPGTLT